MIESLQHPRLRALLYRGMDRATLDAAYNNTAAVADSAEWLARWRERAPFCAAPLRRRGATIFLRGAPARAA